MKKQTDGMAIASLVLGLVGIILGWIPLIGWGIVLLAFIFGILSLKRIKREKHLEGKGLAITGIILSGVILFVYLIILTGLGLAFIQGLFGGTVEKLGELKDQSSQSVAVSDKRKVIGYAMNQAINVDYLTYKITKVETFTKMGSSFFNKETNGKFVKVYLEITNNDKSTKQIFSPRFTLIDHKQRAYDRFPSDMLYIADALEFGKQLQPGLKVSGAIVFELPKDSRDLRLSIRGGWLSISEVEIDLDYIRNIYTDRTLELESKQKVSEVVGGFP